MIAICSHLNFSIVLGTGYAQMLAIWDLINEYGLAEFVVAFSFDTTSSNSGDKSGACVLLDTNFTRRNLNLACRHHIFEIFLGAAFVKILGNSGNLFYSTLSNFLRFILKITFHSFIFHISSTFYAFN